MAFSMLCNITGTNTGPREISPIAKFVDFLEIAFLRFTNGKLKEEFPDNKNLSLIEQPGATITLPAGEKK